MTSSAANGSDTAMRDRLVGVWRLVSFREERGAVMVDFLGPNPKGYITYTPGGHMSALLAGQFRPRFRGAWDAVPADVKAANFDGLVAYSGRFTAGPDRVTHHVDLCWIPNWEGRDLVRLVSFDGDDRLVLRTEPRPDQATQEVVWERAEAGGVAASGSRP